jgi:hypothetical protein
MGPCTSPPGILVGPHSGHSQHTETAASGIRLPTSPSAEMGGLILQPLRHIATLRESLGLNDGQCRRCGDTPGLQ